MIKQIKKIKQNKPKKFKRINLESTHISFFLNDRDPTTSKGLVLQKNSLHDAGGSSSVMHYTEENKENYR